MAHRAVLAAVAAITLVAVLASGQQAARAATTVTWTGGDAANSLWSDPNNWSPSVPIAGDSLVFPQAASRKTNTNDLAASTSFASITFSGSGYVIGGNSLVLTSLLSHVPAGGSNTINLGIGGPGGVEVKGGKLTLAGNNSYAGETLVQAGVLVANNSNSLGTAAGGTQVIPGGTLVVQDGIDLFDEVEVGGDGGEPDEGAIQSPFGTNSIDRVVLTQSTVIGVSNSNLMIPELASPAGLTLTLLGGGKLEAGGSEFDGSLDVVEGNLTWHANSAAAAHIDDDGWLRGTGTLGSVEVDGGLVWPGFGSSPGILTVVGGTRFDRGAFRVDLDGAVAGSEYGRLVTGSLMISPVVVQLQLDLGFSPPIGQVLTIIQNGGGAVEGTFHGLPEGAVFQVEGFAFQISYKGGDGNDVTLKVLRQVSADLVLSATAQPSPVATGGLLVYTITVQNHGPDAATDVHPTMGTPVGTTFESATGPAGWTCFKPNPSVSVTCNGPSLASGASAVFVFSFRVNGSATSPISGTASVSAETPDPNSANNAQTLATPIGASGGLPFKLRLPGVAADSAGSGSEG